MSDLISKHVAIDIEGLYEEIRCEICRNPMHTSRGCDGNCTYDEKLYEKIMQILDRRIKHVPSVQPEVAKDTNVGDMISRRVAIVQLSHNKTGDDDCDVVIQNDIETIKALPSAQQDYRTDHGYMWLCPECGLSVHSDFVKCVRCGFVRHDTQQDYEWKEG